MSNVDILERLYRTVWERRKADPDVSYIAKRFKQGTAKIAQKFGEESVETVIAAVAGNREELIDESADMLFHWLLLIADGGIEVADVMKELERREGISGLDEKASRKLKSKS
ncbi:MAG: phosphoribosyl-ATP diphosphatase [Rickettsiales bacterium]